jgi:hypothetical protein
VFEAWFCMPKDSVYLAVRCEYGGGAIQDLKAWKACAYTCFQGYELLMRSTIRRTLIRTMAPI